MPLPISSISRSLFKILKSHNRALNHAAVGMRRTLGRRINIYGCVQPLKGERHLSIGHCVHNPKQPCRQGEAEGIVEVVENKQTSQKSKCIFSLLCVFIGCSPLHNDWRHQCSLKDLDWQQKSHGRTSRVGVLEWGFHHFACGPKPNDDY